MFNLYQCCQQQWNDGKLATLIFLRFLGGCLTNFTGWGLGGAIGGGGGGTGGKYEASLSDASDDDGDGVGSLTTKST